MADLKPCKHHPRATRNHQRAKEHHDVLDLKPQGLHKLHINWGVEVKVEITVEIKTV